VQVTVAGQDELTEIRNESRLKLKDSPTDVITFLLSLGEEYPITTKKATELV
jgi:ssRNA-specific RNase YbeY (16S rRNA maturation enzyme)